MRLQAIVATLEGCSFAALDDAVGIEAALRQAVEAGEFTLLHHYVHPFEPQGVTAAAVLAESHIAIHTWPEDGVLFIDIATCSRPGATEAAFRRICDAFEHTDVQRQEFSYVGPRPKVVAGSGI